MWLDDSFKYDKNNEVLSNITILNNTHNAELQLQLFRFPDTYLKIAFFVESMIIDKVWRHYLGIWQ